MVNSFASLPQTSSNVTMPNVKPPLGIIPAKLFYETRIEELKQAMRRRVDADMSVPLEWVEEYNELIRKYG